MSKHSTYAVMGSKSEQLLARLNNAIVDSGIEDFATLPVLDQVLDEVGDYLVSNEQFVDRMAARGDLS